MAVRGSGPRSRWEEEEIGRATSIRSEKSVRAWPQLWVPAPPMHFHGAGKNVLPFACMRNTSSVSRFAHRAVTNRPSVPPKVDSKVSRRSLLPLARRGMLSRDLYERKWSSMLTPNKLCVDSHACHFVELPTPPGAARGVRIIFDPVFSKRCSLSSFPGPARFTGKALALDAPARSHFSPSHAHKMCLAKSKTSRYCAFAMFLYPASSP
jgi:hypothetical protein